MHKDLLVKIKLRFYQPIQKQNIFLTAYYPFIDELFYKPIKWTLDKGFLSDKYKINKSYVRKMDREKKDKLLKDFFVPYKRKPGIFKLKKRIVYFNDFKPIGGVSFVKKLTAANSNRDASLFIRSKNKKFNGLKLLKLLQNPKPFNERDFDYKSLNEIKFDNFLNIYIDKIEDIYLKYNQNLITCSTKKLKSVFNIYGQFKNFEKFM